MRIEKKWTRINQIKEMKRQLKNILGEKQNKKIKQNKKTKQNWIKRNSSKQNELEQNQKKKYTTNKSIKQSRVE